MTNCKECLWYDPGQDEMKRSGEDVAFVGKEPPDNHYCLPYNPIDPDVWDGKKNCDQFVRRES